MGWRFYRRVKILPGVTLNFSKRGTSLSVGGRGAHVTLGRGRERETIGIPGSGISYTTTQKASRTAPAPGTRRTLYVLMILAILLLLALLSHSTPHH
ncbi:MAG TPA: DUF4236 domain-containing protein [Candidatus Binataceae bacterium]|nr:DUF4236 domain-containing protein [Candidatus Binataceae bacterium]